jgi:hypothetical protein
MTSPTIPQSQKKKDGGRIPGPQNCANVGEFRFQVQLPNSKLSYWTVHGYFGGTISVTQSMANSLFSAVSSAWTSNLTPFLATTTILQNCQIRDMTSYTNPILTSVGTAVPGTSASPAMPVNNAIVITENLNIRGRGAKGRIYLGGWSTNAESPPGVIAPGLVTALGAFCTALFNAVTAAPSTPAVAKVHRAEYYGVTGTLHPERLSTYATVNQYVVRDNVFDTQRRRIAA